MTPKEKAKELVDKIFDKMFDLRDGYNSTEVYNAAKECALIAVDELIIQNGELYLNGLDSIYYREKNNFLFEVKQELEKL